MVRISFIAVLFLFVSWNTSFAQTDVFATVELSETEVFPEEPIKFTVTVGTATWFTSPLDFDNIQVQNSFVIPFRRTFSTMREIRGKQYACLQFYYLVYPYQSGEYEIPELNIVAETPPVGEYKGVKVNLKTQAKSFSVKPKPADFEGEWFVSKNVSISQSWDRSLKDLRVGDVVERTITIEAYGALPNFIPEVDFADPDFGSVYPKSGKLKDKRNDKDVNGSRIDKAVYLLEKEGEYTLPPIRIYWWNPYSEKVLYKDLEEIIINIESNPDLGMVATLRDSLDTANAGQLTTEGSSEDTKGEILGLPWWQFLIVLVLGLIVLSFIIKRLKVLNHTLASKREAYKNSEISAFKKINGSSTASQLINSTYEWWDKFRVAYELPASFKEGLSGAEHEGLEKVWLEMENQANTNADFDGASRSQFLGMLKSYREELLKHAELSSSRISVNQTPW